MICLLYYADTKFSVPALPSPLNHHLWPTIFDIKATPSNITSPMAVLKAAAALLLLNFISHSQAAAPSGAKEALLTFTVGQGNAIKTFSLAAYDTVDKPTLTTQVTIDNAPATVVIGPYKNVHMMTAAPLAKRVPDDIGDHGEPDSDAPGSQPPPQPSCPADPNAPIPNPTPIPKPGGQGGPPPPSAPDPISTPQPPPAPYAQGVCTFHLTQWYYGGFAQPPYGLEIAMKDANGGQIGWQVHTAAGATKPLNVKSKLEAVFVLTPEEQNDYIQFTLGDQSWASNQKFGANDVPSCTVGGWDGSDYPSVSHRSRFLLS